MEELDYLITEEEKKEFCEFFVKYVKNYVENIDKKELNEWLNEIFTQETTNKSFEEIGKLTEQSINDISKLYDEYERMNEYLNLGFTYSDYFANKFLNEIEINKKEKEILKEWNIEISQIEKNYEYQLLNDKKIIDYEFNFEENMMTKEILKSIGEKSLNNIFLSMILFVSQDVHEKIMNDKNIENEEILKNAINVGKNTGLTTAVYGILIMAVEKGLIRGAFQNKNILSATAFSVVESVRILSEIGKNEISEEKGWEELQGVIISFFTTITVTSYNIGANFVPLVFGALGVQPVTVIAVGIVNTVLGTVGSDVLKNTLQGIEVIKRGVLSRIADKAKIQYERITNSAPVNFVKNTVSNFFRR